jgi:hypothetical protein
MNMANQNNRKRTFWDFNLQSIENGFYNINLNLILEYFYLDMLVNQTFNSRVGKKN